MDKDSDKKNQDLFLCFKKYCEDKKESIIQILVKDKKHSIMTESWEEIVCILQESYGKPFVDSAYGREYHILLQKWTSRYGCNIEHRCKPSSRNGRLLNPTSWKVSLLKRWDKNILKYQEASKIEKTNADIITKLNQV